MIDTQRLLDSVLSKNMFEYLLVDISLCVVNHSDGLNRYFETELKLGEQIIEVIPELIGSESEIEAIFQTPTKHYHLETVYKNGYYINIMVEYYQSDSLLVLIQNTTEMVMSKQKLLQYSNESLLLNQTLQKILDRQNAYVFVTYNEKIVFTNQQLLDYFKVKDIDDLNQLEIVFYKHCDIDLNSYLELFERVHDKEAYVSIDNDTFILQASLLESTHKLFTLTRITNLSNKLQYDTLTKAHKKEYFNKQLEKMILLEQDASVILLDLDDFKKVNDRYGHQVGDDVLRNFSKLIQENINDEDLFARWGGEEFLLLLRSKTLDEACSKAEELCQLVSDYHFNQVKNITVSLGVASISLNDTLHSVLLRADKALYEAKKAGKNRVVAKKLKFSKK